MGLGWDRRTIGGTRVEQEDQRWDMTTLGGTGGGTVRPGVGQSDQGWDRWTRIGTEGPGVGQRDHRWDRRTSDGNSRGTVVV